MPRHPLQPLGRDENGVIRFKENKLVRFLLDAGPFDLNQIARMDFSDEDREQFAQLIGYSHSGACGLSYFSGVALIASYEAYNKGITELEARLGLAEEKLKRLKSVMREATADLYDMNPNDLVWEET